MATQTNISIRKGRTGTILINVTGISVWTDMLAKLVVAKEMDTDDPVMELTGTIDSVANTATFPYVHDDTKDLDKPSYYYEVIIYKADKSYIKDTNYGVLRLETVVKVDPTT